MLIDNEIQELAREVLPEWSLENARLTHVKSSENVTFRVEKMDRPMFFKYTDLGITLEMNWNLSWSGQRRCAPLALMCQNLC